MIFDSYSFIDCNIITLVFFFSMILDLSSVFLFGTLLGVELLISRTRDVTAVCAFVVIGLIVGIAVSADFLDNKSGLFIIPVQTVLF